MRAGHPLTEDQRRPWLLTVADWIRAHDLDGGVVSCSALRRGHRAILRGGAARAHLLHLTGDPVLIRDRLVARRHFMPASLLDSQLATLEAPTPDERHVTVDVNRTPDEVVAAFLRGCGAEISGSPNP
jgi:gluconokinase